MGENYKYYSEMERYEIININDGEKYNYLSNNDIVIDEDGYLKLLIINEAKNKRRDGDLLLNLFLYFYL